LEPLAAGFTLAAVLVSHPSASLASGRCAPRPVVAHVGVCAFLSLPLVAVGGTFCCVLQGLVTGVRCAVCLMADTSEYTYLRPTHVAMVWRCC
jgi:hypothetical protein